MDICEDGSSFEPSARKIFGDRYDAFSKIHSDGDRREELRKDQVAAYVKKNGLLVTKYQDYGWDPIVIQ